MPSPHALVFDLDGVLVDTSRLWHRVVSDVVERLSHRAPTWESFCATFGQGTAADVEQFCPGITVEELDRLYAERFLARIGEVERIDGAPELLEELGRRGILRAVATNTVREVAIAILETAGLAAGIDVVASASEVPRAKPAPDVLLLAVERLGVSVSREQALYVGDAVYDAEAAAAAGIRFVGFRREGTWRVEGLGEILGLVGHDSGR